ncbi:ATP-binding cassette domain-containing protein [Aeromicrobium ginsengisoli]|uniref:ATP-binding cassette domain-containing protein n=1 Tax=Aeromicrobium ginsengisoli TaxID=363867 RepID=A0A5M4FFH1_9ACTN|nr:ATP-binding cassette domain-containing protein [Aeromicrobium ginsengisoli]KAA1397978.1 ATP-binding cassette domain-containing protein [Aeromicrobium ginsengisoli]
MTYTVTATGLHKAYGDHVVLDGIDLAVATGSVFSLLGPNGAGKTTLVRILATLLAPDSGTATIAGHDLVTDPLGVREVISLTGQYAAVDEVLTAEENLLMMAQLRHLPRRVARQRVEDLLVEFDLVEARSRRVGTFSGGMTRRLDLAISMIERPELLFLDEPTTGLDPRSREQVWGTVRQLVDDGVTILLTTQYLEEADQLADRIAVLDGGAIVAEGTAAELKSTIGGELLRIELGDAESFGRAVTQLSPERTDERLLSVEVPTDGSPAEIVALLARLEREGLVVRKVTTVHPSLDDVFFSLTERRAA